MTQHPDVSFTYDPSNKHLPSVSFKQNVIVGWGDLVDFDLPIEMCMRCKSPSPSEFTFDNIFTVIQTPYDCLPNYPLQTYTNPITFPYVYNGGGNQYGVLNYINDLADPNCSVV